MSDLHIPAFPSVTVLLHRSGASLLASPHEIAKISEMFPNGEITGRRGESLQLRDPGDVALLHLMSEKGVW